MPGLAPGLGAQVAEGCGGDAGAIAAELKEVDAHGDERLAGIFEPGCVVDHESSCLDTCSNFRILELKTLEFSDFFPSIIKSFFFGFAIGLVGCFKGYYCEKGTEGVGVAANSAVVYTSMLLFVIDFIAVLVTDIFYEL